ncbi:hypothetical protein WBG78_25280 [Chryseolinea sp. T2]|uniref:hypothetical protein n=1 Tax=Chryseolinea sp. T2 TaxID=3129255 RepID=UPI003077CC69
MKTLTLILLFATHLLPAQDLKWHEGSVVLASGEVVVGQVSMMAGRDVVLLRRATNVSILPKGDINHGADVLPAHKVQSVFYYDKQDNVNRRFVSHAVRHNSKAIQLYEIVLQGGLNVLRRTRSTSDSADAGDFDYFVDASGAITPLWKFYRDVYPALDETSKQHLTAYAKANGLQHADEANLIRIVGYYNQLVRTGEKVARN